MPTQDKVDAVAEIADRFRSASAAVVTEYRGLSVRELGELRRDLGDTATYRIAKNRLVARAAADAGVQGLEDLWTGPTAIAFVEGEPVDAAKALRDFARTHRELAIKGGYMDGRPLSVAEVNQLADLESREVLLARLAGALQANLTKAARLFNAPASQVARLAAALQDKKAAGEPAGAAEPAEPGETAEPAAAAESAESAESTETTETTETTESAENGEG